MYPSPNKNPGYTYDFNLDFAKFLKHVKQFHVYFAAPIHVFKVNSRTIRGSLINVSSFLWLLGHTLSCKGGARGCSGSRYKFAQLVNFRLCC